MSNSTRLGLLVTLMVALCATAVRATPILNEDFESYANQAAVQVVWPAVGTGTAPGNVFITTGGGAGGSTKWLQTPTSVASVSGNYRNRKVSGIGELGAVSTSNAVMLSFDFFDNNGAGAPTRNYANIQDTITPGVANQLVSMGMNNTLTVTADGGNYYHARILGYDGGTGAGAYFKLNQGPASTLRQSGANWRNLKVVITNTNYKFYVDGVLAATEIVANTVSYDNVALGSGLSSSSVITGFDNVKLVVDALAVQAASPNHNGDSGVGSENGGLMDVALDWDTGTNDKWNLFLWKTGDPVPGSPTAPGLTASDYLAAGLDPETQYNWRVDSLNEFDDLAGGSVWSFETAAVPEPAVAGLALLAGMFWNRRRRS